MKKLILFTTLLYSYYSHATCPKNALSIVTKMINIQELNSEHEKQGVFIINLKTKKKIQRSLERFALKTKNSTRKSLVNFISPAAIKGTALLSWHSNDKTDQWLYLPSGNKLQRIASGNKKNYFMGTDFTYADLDGEIKADYSYQCTKVTKCSNNKSSCFEIIATPKSKKIMRQTGYKKRILYIDTKHYYPHSIKYFNKGNKHFKTANYQNWVKVGKKQRPNLASMERHGIQKTYLKVQKREPTNKVKPLYFSKRFLEKRMHIK